LSRLFNNKNEKAIDIRRPGIAGKEQMF